MVHSILVASSSLDVETTGRVTKILKERGHRVVSYDTDRVVSGSVKSSVRIDNKSQVVVSYGKTVFSDAQIDAAWCRRPDLFFYARDDAAASLSLELEARKTFANIWESISSRKWLNTPANMIRAQHKIPQLAAAQSVGFTIPNTIITNTWKGVIELGPRSVMKMAANSTICYQGDASKSLFTTVLDRKAIARIKNSSPFPGLFESYFAKRREWRITVVGDQIFPVAIYTTERAKDDWRKHQDSSSLVQFKHEELPDPAIADKCKVLLKHYDLRYGAFDFIETPEGEIIFLEVNPNGQYGWLEHELGLSISKAIADELIAIATANRHETDHS